MAFEHWVDGENRLLWVSITGSFETKDIFELLSETVNHPDFEPGFNIISDHTKIERFITTPQVKDTARFMHTFSEKLVGARWAVITSHPASYGMMRMLSVFIEDIPIDMKIFDKKEEALGWLGIENG